MPDTDTDIAPVRWGLAATGRIAHAFARDLSFVPGASITAVGSRTLERADAFADEFGIPNRHAAYEDLFGDPSVDAVYISPPHPGHYAATLAAIAGNKAVLCEKPLAMSAAEAAEMVGAARSARTLLLEAMWTRFLPHIARVREILAAGTLGEIVYLTAEHGQWFERDAAHRIYAPLLGGGALLDLGIYPVSFAHLVLGPPSQITARSTPAFTGVDATTSMILEYPSGAHAVLTTSLAAQSNNPAVIYGTEARLEIDGWFYTPGGITVVARSGEVLERYEPRVAGRGMEYEAMEVGRCLGAGLTESPLLPLDESVAIMQVLDEIRSQIGLDYEALTTTR